MDWINATVSIPFLLIQLGFSPLPVRRDILSERHFDRRLPTSHSRFIRVARSVWDAPPHAHWNVNQHILSILFREFFLRTRAPQPQPRNSLFFYSPWNPPRKSSGDLFRPKWSCAFPGNSHLRSCERFVVYHTFHPQGCLGSLSDRSRHKEDISFFVCVCVKLATSFFNPASSFSNRRVSVERAFFSGTSTVPKIIPQHGSLAPLLSPLGFQRVNI